MESIIQQKFTSSKVFDGYSTTFRQWRAEGTHCKFLHGYGVSLRVWFEGDLDEKNWVWDFGGMKRSNGKIDGLNPKEWLDYMLDHTTIVAQDDPYLDMFKQLDINGLIQLRILPAVGAERFAEYFFNRLNEFVRTETNNRVQVSSVEFREHEKNTASYSQTTIK